MAEDKTNWRDAIDYHAITEWSVKWSVRFSKYLIPWMIGVAFGVYQVYDARKISHIHEIDINRDGRTDLVIERKGAKEAIYLRNKEGQLERLANTYQEYRETVRDEIGEQKSK